AWLRPGTHLDLVGAFTPRMRESDDEAVRRAEVFVDTREGAESEAGDLLQAIEAGAFSWEGVRADLFELCRGEHPGRRDDREVTLFKSVGTALEDLFAAVLAWERARG
ncbi:MAG TPA: ornithine cyclodeaminase family protein, partial [Thermoanaerobaculia bacterium]|nr:ornithine cyclodeaminase family protein [Thermoanaerobaculia bacterium]